MVTSWGHVINTPEILAFLLAGAQHEIMLFAACGLVLGGLDDALIDILFFWRWLWRRLFIYSRYQPMTTATLPDAVDRAPLAIFVPAWDEAAVIGQMLRDLTGKWGAARYRVFVGAYPNDPATIGIVAAAARDRPVIMPVVTARPGPTTKADCLNALWDAMLRDEAATGQRYKAVILHDAEDVVHPDALRLLDRMADRFDLVQLPVKPYKSQYGSWVSGHYLDEFAEAHGKYLCVREAIGAAVPSAGVGCAFSRAALARLAAEQGGHPFDPGSLTEDYEIGLRIVEHGGRSVFVRMADALGEIVCTREHFPDTLRLAVRQKARWTVGIALAGWDRMGWGNGLAERWMRLRDRRAALAALILFAAYLSLVLQLPIWMLALAGAPSHLSPSPLLSMLLLATGVLMAWRLIIRMLFVTRAHGWTQGLLSVPRTFVANLVAILAARRAIFIYLGTLRGHPLIWDKTPHVFPAAMPTPAA
ncbi:glycosyl transferase family protein [Sphingobium aquiterrae]|uniref:glycosyl transferase family protein n=1 Tax=Sphingobium aquiterrae TaxID=2038656 RepID=UPI003016255C